MKSNSEKDHGHELIFPPGLLTRTTEMMEMASWAWVLDITSIMVCTRDSRMGVSIMQLELNLELDLGFLCPLYECSTSVQ